MKKLTDLLQAISYSEVIGGTDRCISAIEFDTRSISGDDPTAKPLYIAQRGTQVDGHRFIGQAIAQGAGTIVCDTLPEQPETNITYIKVNNTSEALGHLAAAFYDYPSAKLKLVGITGTNGKTTIATLLHRLFTKMDYKAGLISTIENIVGDEVFLTKHTTPDAVNLNKILSKMVDAGCEYCFMEVSSHAVCQHRIDGLAFAGGVFSNITHDHLDFHETFANYIQAKQGFFNQLSKEAFALTNKDDKNGLVIVQNSKANIKSYSLNTMADFKGKILNNSLEGLHLSIDNQEIFFRLSGRFNAYNLLAIYGTATLLGLPKEDVLVALSGLESAAGRFQLVRNQQNCKAIVDYAHTPDALQNVLSTIYDITQNSVEIITVLGCGGDRDALKRPLMAEMACKYSNKVILTSDNPRSEEPAKILEDMEAGVPIEYKRNVLIIENRREAIKTACMMLQEEGVLLVAGKGHETYQEIKGVRHHFDDMEVINEFFNPL